jgi:transcriptional regulator with XRE-family HTH domain
MSLNRLRAENHMDLGLLLKKIRLDRGFTLAEVAEAVGVTSGLLSQLENGKTSPSINSLEGILRFYRMPLSEFFRQIEKENSILVRASDVETFDTKEEGVSVSLLASKLGNNVLESYKITLSETAKIPVKSTPPEKNGERFILLLAGSIEVALPDENLILNAGDSLNFKSYLSCTIKNTKDEKAEFILNGNPPIF